MKTDETDDEVSYDPIGMRILVRKDEDKKQTKGGIHLPENSKVPSITGTVIKISSEIKTDHQTTYPIDEGDKIIYTPFESIPVDLEDEFAGKGKMYIVPIENVYAIIRGKAKTEQRDINDLSDKLFHGSDQLTKEDEE